MYNMFFQLLLSTEAFFSYDLIMYNMFFQLLSADVFFSYDLASVYQQRVGSPLQSHGGVLQRKGKA